MDMQIDSKRVRAERERRAWSQDHLAEVSGVALRTIQRVEASGNGSYETVKSLAAVFGCGVVDLMGSPKATPEISATPPRAAEVATAMPSRPRRWLSAAVAAAATVAIGAFFATTASAGQVLLDIALTVNEQSTGKHQLITAEGKDAEIVLDGQMRLIVTPTVTDDGNVAMSIQLFEADGEKFTLVSTPSVVAYDNHAAKVTLTSKKGSVFGIAITPHKLKS